MRDYTKKVRVLHIAPHLGGGVGRVLVSFLRHANLDEDFSHKILCFDYINERAKENLTKYNIDHRDLLHNDSQFVLREISEADIVVFHWWNHPMLYQFFVSNPLPASRTIIWSHVSGNEAPQLFTQQLFDYSDNFVFTTPMSYFSEEVISYKGDRNKFKSIWSTGGLDHVQNVSLKRHHGFNVGYIGTVDYVKLFPNVIDLCAKVNIPNIKFYFCGGAEELVLVDEVKRRGLQDKFVFTGYVENISEYLEIFDVFGYPLSSSHYGTCDQALAEAMSVGLVPVVFNNKMESYMVQNMHSGIVAESEEDYVKAIEELYKNRELKSTLSRNAKEDAQKRFSIQKTLDDWGLLFEDLLLQPKTEKKWVKSGLELKTEGHIIFLEAIGKYSEVFLNGNENDIKNLSLSSHSWRSKTKGTVHHYASCFAENELLQKWSDLMK